MASTAPRLYHLQGSARAIGLAIGQRMGPRLEQNIGHYLHHGSARYAGLDWDRLRRDALTWLHRLPGRFQDELEGLALGAGLPLQRIAEWCFADECLARCGVALVMSRRREEHTKEESRRWLPQTARGRALSLCRHGTARADFAAPGSPGRIPGGLLPGPAGPRHAPAPQIRGLRAGWFLHAIPTGKRSETFARFAHLVFGYPTI
jgi:hypothetical protein